MRRLFSVLAVILALAALSGCGRKAETVSEMSSDSLLATNPVEQPEGNLTPQSEYQEPQPQAQTPPAPAPSTPPRRSSNPPRRSPSNPSNPSTPSSQPEPGVTVAAGTPIAVALSTQISSENAQVGDSWTGEVKENVIVGNTVVIPAGSVVHGVVSTAVPAGGKDSRATLGLEVRSVSVNGRDVSVHATTEPVVAGSPRARNLGAIAGGAAAGALIGKAVGGSGKGAVIGGLIGGAAAGAGVAASKGYQVVLKKDVVLTFSVDQSVNVRS